MTEEFKNLLEKALESLQKSIDEVEIAFFSSLSLFFVCVLLYISFLTDL